MKHLFCHAHSIFWFPIFCLPPPPLQLSFNFQWAIQIALYARLILSGILCHLDVQFYFTSLFCIRIISRSCLWHRGYFKPEVDSTVPVTLQPVRIYSLGIFLREKERCEKNFKMTGAEINMDKKNLDSNDYLRINALRVYNAHFVLDNEEEKKISHIRRSIVI